LPSEFLRLCKDRDASAAGFLILSVRPLILCFMLLPRSVSCAIDKIAREALGKDWALYAALLERWPEIVGHEYAHNTSPVKITFPPRQQEAQRTGGILVIRLPKGLAMEFTFRIEQIRQRITTYFGYEAIAKITFEPYFAAPPRSPGNVARKERDVSHIEEAVSVIDSAELRDALMAFGKAAACE